MLKRMQEVIFTDEEEKDINLANWAWDSHSWIEYYPGYYKCEWCGLLCTSLTPITKDYPICKSNPIIEAILKENK
jgi:hypothetical protein